MFRASGRICELCCRVSVLRSGHNIKTVKKLNCEIPAPFSANIQRWQPNHGRSFTTSQVRRLGDHNDQPPDLSNDPLIKEWMREMQQDFGREGKRETEQKQNIISENQSDLALEENTIEPGEEYRRIDIKQKELLREGMEGREMTKRRDRQEENQNEIIFEKRLQVGDDQQQSTPKTPLQAWAQFNTPKYEIFDSTPQQIIYDYNEEKLRREEGLVEEEEQEEERRERIHLERGERGVFDIDELVELLREENGKDIVVVQVPADMSYVEQLVIVTSRSQRHSNALAQIVHRAYKAKKGRKDPALIVEGKGTDWVAMDMRNIALHIMDRESRESYDLDTLWSVGAEYDDNSQQPSDDLLSVYSRLDPMAGLTAAKTITTPRESS